MPFFQSIPRLTKTYHTKTYDRIAKHHGFNAEGKTILITGGAKGVGYSFSKAFAEAGVARIAIISRTPEDLENAKNELGAASPNTEILTYHTSVTDTTRIEEILRELGTIDVVILNASVAHRRAKGVDISVQEVQDSFDTNVVAPFALTKAYLSMPTPQKKTILNVSSVALQISGMRVAYGPSKAAAAQVMQQLVADQQGDDTRIISFHPGVIYTPGTAANGIPKNLPHWEDINLPAHFALWLAGPEGGFLHGRYVWAQWDVDELLELKSKLKENPEIFKIGLKLEEDRQMYYPRDSN